jgi:hypothetical protein
MVLRSFVFLAAVSFYYRRLLARAQVTSAQRWAAIRSKVG